MDEQLVRRPEQTGTVIVERYLLETEIGRGAMGAVWAAEDLVSGERVALKILGSASVGRIGEKRFLREVASVLALNHPHIVAIRGHGQTTTGDNFLAMELLAGRTLAAILSDLGELSVSRSIGIASQILDAMAAAHRLAILHRDLKPANIMMVSEGADASDFVKVCDFGLAKFVSSDDARSSVPRALRSESAATSMGEVCGTAGYMAPEQARGDEIDGRTDLYAVSVMLFEMLVGRRPFLGRSPFAVVSQHLAARPPSPRGLRPDLNLPLAVEALILRGLAKEREQRPCSAEVFRAELLQIERDRMAASRRRSLQNGVPDTLVGPSRPAGSPPPGRVIPGWLLESVAGGIIGLALAGRFLATDGPPAPAPGEVAAAPVAPLSMPAVHRPDVPRDQQADSPPPPPPPPTEVRTTPRAADRPSQRRVVPGRGRLAVGPPPGGADVPAARTTAALADAAPAPASASPSVPASDSEGSRLDQAEELLANNQIAAACALAEKVAAAHPRLAAVRSFLGRCYMRLGQPQRARASYRAYLSLAPEAADAAFVRAIVAGAPQ